MVMQNNFFQFRTVWKLTPLVQILIIIGLYITMIVFGYFEFQKTGLLQGLPVHISVLFVPIYEEVIFRGLILGALIKVVSNKKAIVLSSLLFGLWHLKNIFFLNIPDLAYQIAYAALFFGPLTAYIALKTKTIWLGVILHYLNNILAPISWLILSLVLSIS